MILTITPNPAQDSVLTVSELRQGRWFRATSAHRTPGGRGVNVSIMLKQLGYESVAMGFLAGHSGAFIRENLLERGISTDFVRIKGENRTNTYITDTLSGLETTVTDPGPTVFEDAQKRFFWSLERLLPRATAVHMGGSIPPGVPNTFFMEIINRVRRRNIPVYVDAFGGALDKAIEALPTLVKIDHRFMDTIRGISLSALEHLMSISKKLFDEGIDWVVTSYFNNSNLFCTTKGFFLAEIKLDDLMTFRDAGDALMAGMMVSRLERMGVEDAIRFAMSCVRLCVTTPQKGLSKRSDVDAMLGSVTIQKL